MLEQSGQQIAIFFYIHANIIYLSLLDLLTAHVADILQRLMWVNGSVAWLEYTDLWLSPFHSSSLSQKVETFAFFTSIQYNNFLYILVCKKALSSNFFVNE